MRISTYVKIFAALIQIKKLMYKNDYIIEYILNCNPKSAKTCVYFINIFKTQNMFIIECSEPSC